jgi:isopenicillin-N N-acyltransferase-like protein
LFQEDAMTASAEYPRLKLSGTGYEIGRTHGAAFAPLIRDNIGFYLSLFDHWAKLKHDEVLARARTFIPIIEKFDRDLMDEIRGIADGADAMLEEIMALNARTEIMFTGGSTHGECTSMAAMPEAASSGHMLIGQNWDWLARVRDNSVVLEIEQRSKPRVLTFTEAGFVGKIGMNDAGIGLCANLLVTDKTVPGIPFHLFCRGIMNSASLSQAIGLVYGNRAGAASNYMIGHAGGEVVDLEASPQGTDYLYADAGVLNHTNHFESGLQVNDRAPKIAPDTIVRYCRSGRMLRAQSGRVTLDTFRSILRDHFNHPSAICRHVDEALPETEQFQTNASVLMDLTEGAMYVCRGTPCSGDYRELRFSGPGGT